MIKIICQFCHKEFKVIPYRKKIAKYCSWECYTKSERSEETRLKMSIAHKGNKFGCLNKGRKFSEEHKRKISEAQKGEKGNNWKGGKYITPKGYIRIMQPNHPFAYKNGYILEHRLIIEQQVRRYLKPKETSHHLGKKNDNRPCMLMAFISHSAHLRFQKNPNNVKPEEIIFDGRKFNLQLSASTNL